MKPDLILPAVISEKVNGHGLILYDGGCGFCQYWVQFVLNRDQAGYYRFAPLQSPWASVLYEQVFRTKSFESVALLENGILTNKSTAALRIVSRFKGFWKIVIVFMLVPKSFRDLIYDYIAKRRHHMVNSEFCLMLSIEQKTRFL